MRFFVLIFFLISDVATAALVYKPTTFDPATAQVVVVIHGCLQSGESMAMGAGFNLIADKNNLLVIYPQVPDGHPLGCWSWYLPENQRSDGGQLKSVHDLVRATIQAEKMSDPRVHLVGISSGGATVAGLLACFPNDYKSAAIHSAPSYALATDAASAEVVLRDGPKRETLGPCHPQEFNGRLIVVQGSADAVVNPRHAERWMKDFLGADQPAKTNRVSDLGGRYTQSDYVGRGRGRIIKVDGLGHAWSGSKANLRYPKLPTTIPFFSSTGPEATRLMWDYLLTP
ncbi:MAG: PHB depolymerase family esterase [Bdellovibrionales bacterium]